jgi:hypothetical protein
MIRPSLSIFAAAVMVAAIAAPVAAQQTPARPAPSAQTPAPVAQADIAWAKETLTALGFNAGRADGAVTDLFRQRLREFQGRNSLTVNGQLDDPTVAKLMEMRPRNPSMGTLTLDNQPPPEVRGGAAPAPPPAAPRAAPQAPVAAERSTATGSSLAVIARGGSPAPSPAPSASPTPSTSPALSAPRPTTAPAPTTAPSGAPQQAVTRLPLDPRTEARVDALLAPQPQAAPRSVVEGGPRPDPGAATASASGLSLALILGWAGVAGLVLFCAVFVAIWWTSGRRQPSRYAGLSAAGAFADRRAPTIGMPTSGLTKPSRTGLTAVAIRR